MRLLTGSFDEDWRYATVRKHGGSTWLVILTLDGEGIIRSRDVDFARKGSFTVFPPEAYQNYGTSPEVGRWKLVWAHFQAYPHWRTLLESFPNEATIHHFEDHQSPKMQELFLRVVECCDRPLWAMHYLEEFFMHWSELVEPKGMESPLGPALDWIDRHFGQDVSVDSLALLCRLSPGHFSRLFRAHLGTTPRVYIERRRLTVVMQLLEETGWTLTRIAQETGFKSGQYLGTRFLQCFKMTPGEFREAPREARTKIINSLIEV